MRMELSEVQAQRWKARAGGWAGAVSEAAEPDLQHGLCRKQVFIRTWVTNLKGKERGFSSLVLRTYLLLLLLLLLLSRFSREIGRASCRERV